MNRKKQKALIKNKKTSCILPDNMILYKTVTQESDR